MLRSAPPPLLAERHTRRPALRCIHHIAVATVIVTRFDDHQYRYVRFGCIYKTRTVVGIAAYSLQFWLRKGVGHGGILGIRAALPSAAGARRTVVFVERARSSCVNCEVCQQRRRRKQARPRRHARGTLGWLDQMVEDGHLPRDMKVWRVEGGKAWVALGHEIKAEIKAEQKAEQKAAVASTSA